MKNSTDISKNDERLSFEPVLANVKNSITRKKLMDYFRYHHFHTLPIYENHKDFISDLNQLEGFSETQINENTLEKNWNKIKESIGKLKQRQGDELLDTIQRRRGR